MSDRNLDILQQLIKQRSIKESELSQLFDLSARQLSYSIDSINEKLSENHLPTIEKRQGCYYAKNEAAEYLTIQQSIQDIIFSKEDRIYLLIIMILARTEELSLDHFCIELQISKNTALSDIKKAKEHLAKYQLKIEFSRKKGYVISGNEWDKRVVLFHAITKIYKYYGEKVTEELLEGSKKHLEQVKNDVLKIEKYIGVKYTDEDFYPLIYFIASLFIRIEREQLIDGSRIGDREEIERTKEYQSISYITTDFPKLPEAEKLFIALQLLSSNIRNKGMVSEKELPLLANSLWEFLIEFETNTFLVLSDKKDLLKKLLNHFKPAYYRIKYDLSTENVLYDKIRSEYKVLHDFVRQSIGPLEEFFETEIADEEIAYITLFVGGHLIGNDHNDLEEKIIKAVILCPNGISMSKLIEKKLKEIFPEFLFYPTNSVREYKSFVLPHDIVFSTVPVESEKKVYLISEILSKGEQLRLRQDVIKDLYHLDFSGIRSTDILNVVKQYVTVNKKTETNVLEALDSLLLGEQKRTNDEGMGSKNELSQVIIKENILFIEDVVTWETLLRKASQCLIEQNIISSEYTDALLKEYRDQPAYIMLRQRIVLPHLDPTMIEQKLGVCFIVLKQGLEYQDQKIHVVALLTTPDKTSHLTILYHINRMAKDAEFIEQLIALEDEIKITEAIQGFASDQEDQ
ncbi:BglG family transcription antiterminator [Enterococcus hulanensis]|uniref:Ascorbate-specific PTS system EIIA component n=1 Tax=Enterococcus hulanensis TaxID=2559929 RepID=A0ABU3ETY5_9ENTE|nr:BglG family transcription antiterminator [Enterococcus hulanensis]MDT2598329.1 BglG family transcription antiterminator [Enterococcus hulanensis]MDT2608166.1 BglG family transcription antiterminator [Enterococcus hulanensis]MDT2615461.1 BglG family transcription antiterminator [Enterococcus hulanensis]MDT2626568.1 BglG family transcription antiterminator [Enterococcus hulanensis]MDT2654533.1 BglG family transcription antiterminator [Enterococcus hulanensis]